VDRGCDATRRYAEVDDGDPIDSSGNDEAAKNVSAAILCLQQKQQQYRRWKLAEAKVQRSLNAVTDRLNTSAQAVATQIVSGATAIVASIRRCFQRIRDLCREQ
jgi:hypothetical protein